MCLLDSASVAGRDLKVFHTLNSMRGVAAITIVVWHSSQYFGFKLSSSYLAVDLFFVLSGFVLAHAYEHRFEHGLSTISFMHLRFARLFPLFAFGIAISLVGVGLAWVTHAHLTWTLLSLAICALLNLGFLPAPPLHGDAVFPLNGPGWSLFFELFVNFLYVLLSPILSIRVLITVVSLAACALVWCAATFGDLSGGWIWQTFAVGFARVLFSFPAGVLIYRLTREWRPIKLNGLLAIVAMVLILVINPETWRAIYDTIAVLTVIPVIVAFASLTRPIRLLWISSFLGATSYGIYAIHDPIITIVNGGIVRLLHKDTTSVSPWFGAIFLLLILGFVWVLDKYYDGPARRMLS